MTILVDMDGPLAAYDRRFHAECAARGWLLDCAEAEQKHRYATDHVVDRAARKAARALTNAEGWFAGLPVTEGAVKGLTVLEDAVGLENIWICTKPAVDNGWCRDEKFHWLVANFGKKWARRMILAPDKSLVRGTVLLDDAPNPDWFDRAEWEPVIFPVPFNGSGSKWEGIRRWTWGDSVEALLGREEI